MGPMGVVPTAETVELFGEVVERDEERREKPPGVFHGAEETFDDRDAAVRPKTACDGRRQKRPEEQAAQKAARQTAEMGSDRSRCRGWVSHAILVWGLPLSRPPPG